MPHIIMQYSDNIGVKPDFKELFLGLHQKISHLINTDIENCKSRAIKLDNYFSGIGGDKSFIHLEVYILKGRSDQVKGELGQMIIEELKKHYPEPDIQITAHIIDMDKKSYYKFIGT